MTPFLRALAAAATVLVVAAVGLVALGHEKTIFMEEDTWPGAPKGWYHQTTKRAFL